MSEPTIGVIGLGKMGLQMSRNFLEAGEDVVGFDVDADSRSRFADLGGEPRDAPVAVARDVDLFITSLPTPQVVETVLTDDGTYEAAEEGTIHLEMSTIDPGTMIRIGEAAKESGVRPLGAPVSGGPENCYDGSLTIMVGGAEETYRDPITQAALDQLGRKVYHTGGIDAGHTVKLINNAISMSNLLIAFESLSLGVARDVDPAILLEVINNAGGGSNQFAKRVPRVLNRNFEPGFTIDFGRKDLGLALETADQMDQPMFLTNLVHDMFTVASNSGFGEEDAGAIARLYEEYRNVHIEADEPVDESFAGY